MRPPGGRFSRAMRIHPVRHQRHRQHRGGEEQRLGHRRALQVQEVGVGEQQRGGREAAGGGAGRPQDQVRERPGGDRHAHHRERNRKRAGPVEHVDLDRDHVEQVRQRQPHGADLLPARHDAVEDPPRHHQVRTGVVVAERETAVGVVECRRASGEKHERGSDQCGWRASREQGASSLHFGG